LELSEITVAPTINEPKIILKDKRLAEASTLRRRGFNSFMRKFYRKVSKDKRFNFISICRVVFKSIYFRYKTGFELVCNEVSPINWRRNKPIINGLI
jgi:hypothetical protein